MDKELQGFVDSSDVVEYKFLRKICGLYFPVLLMMMEDSINSHLRIASP